MSGILPEPPELIFRSVIVYEVFTELINQRSKKLTGLTLRELIKKINDEGRKVKQRFGDYFTLSSNYIEGKLTDLAEKISSKTDQDSSITRRNDLVEILEFEIHDSILALMKNYDTNQGITERVFAELPNRLGLSTA